MLQAQFLIIIIFKILLAKFSACSWRNWNKIAGWFGTTGSISVTFYLKNIFFLTYSSEILHISIELRNALDIFLTEVSVEARNIEIPFQ